ncbi:MAG: DUF1697 domain-containing protein [Jatrophihabitantaceae bacterium]
MPEQVVALLRGINVGRNKRVAMADLRALLADLGYTNPRTLLNSGNAVFGCPKALVGDAAATIEAMIAERLGVRCAVMTRSGTELAAVVRNNPLAEVATEPARYLVGFLSRPLDEAVVAELHSQDFGAEQLRVLGSEVYLWCAAGIAESVLPKLAWSKFSVDVTTRNWNTVLKLAELAGAS